MQTGPAVRIEASIDRAASGLLGAAAAFSAWALPGGVLALPLRGAAAVAAATLAYVGAVRLLGAVQPESRKLPVPVFDVRDMEPIEFESPLLPQRYALPAPEALLLTEQYAPAAEELLLTERHAPATEQRLETDTHALVAPEEPLVLDDVIAKLEPDSRVIRLFDPVAMPTAGELNQRIERHLVRGAAPIAPNDASEALHEALAELRRSLR